jgi:hypothetical protein
MHLAFISQTSAYHKLAEKQAFFSSLLVDDLEPVNIPQGLRDLGNGVADGIVGADRRAADEFNFSCRRDRPCGTPFAAP